MLIPFPQLLADACAGGYAVGYFEAWDIYSLEAVAEAAEAENVPVILGIGGVMMDPGWFDGGGLERLAAAGLATAQMTRVPTAFILNEVATFGQIMRGIRSGFNAVMLDSTVLPYAEHAAPDPPGGRGGAPHRRRGRGRARRTRPTARASSAARSAT